MGYTRASSAAARKWITDNRRPGAARRPANSVWRMLHTTTDHLERALDEIDRLRWENEAQAKILRRLAKEDNDKENT